MEITWSTHSVSGMRSRINTFSLTAFDKGDYQKAVEQENLAKNLVEVL